MGARISTPRISPRELSHKTAMLLARRGKIRSANTRSQGGGEISGNGRNETQEMGKGGKI